MDIVAMNEDQHKPQSDKQQEDEDRDDDLQKELEETTRKRPTTEETAEEPTNSKYAKRVTRGGTVFSTKDHAGGGKIPQQDLPTRNVLALKSTIQDGGDQPSFEQDVVKIPGSYKEAMKSPQKDKWIEAMDKEYASLVKNNVFTRVKREKGMSIIKTRWVNGVKVDTENEVTAFKSRTVAKGFQQLEGIDYKDTFSPTSLPTTVRSIISHAAYEGRTLIQCDVVTAYLNAPIKEIIYIEPSEGYEKDGDVVWRLNKCLYGLKQSAREWNDTLTTALEGIGFKAGDSDPCLFVREAQCKDGARAGELDIITIHVDDIRGSSPDEVTAEKLLLDIGQLFDIKINGITDTFLGIQTETRKDGSIKINQTGYAKRILARFGMADCKPTSTPMTKDILRKEDCPSTKEEIEVMATKNTLYRSILGSINYLSAWTRPDLTFAVSQLSRFAESPGKVHMEAAKRVLRYISGTVDQGIIFAPKGGPEQWGNTLEAYVDANYNVEPERRKSTTGIYVMLGGSAVYWYSKQQSVVALSTAEAEYVAACQATKEILWARKLVRDFGYTLDTPTVIWEDNQSCIRISENPEMFQRTKHIDIQHHMTRDNVKKGNVVLKYVPSEDQAADMLTKALTKEEILNCLKKANAT